MAKSKTPALKKKAGVFNGLGWLMGLTAHDTNHLIFKDFFGNAMEFDEKT